MNSRTLLLIGVAATLLAAGLRLALAPRYNPVDLDAGHFVQLGLALAHGDSRGSSAYWPQAAIGAAALGERLGVSPARALQAGTLIGGALVAGLGALLAGRIFRSRAAAIAAGLWLATNHALVEYSLNGMAEAPFAACILAAALCVVEGEGRMRGAWRYPAGMACLGLAVYYRPMEAVVATLILTMYVLLDRRGAAIGSWVLSLMAGLLLFAALLYPHLRMVKRETGRYQVTEKLDNIALADAALSRKALYSLREGVSTYGDATRDVEELKQEGTLAYLWSQRARLPARVAANLQRMVRGYNEHLFAGSFRLGAGWFILLGLGCLAAVLANRACARPVLLLLGLALVYPLLATLSYIYPRWLVAGVPLLVVVAAGAAAQSYERLPGAARRVAAGLGLIFLAGSVSYAARSPTGGERWRQYDRIAREVRRAVGDEVRMMTLSPDFIAHYYRIEPFNWVQLRHGEVDDVLEYARQARVEGILLSTWDGIDEWPLSRMVFAGETPEGWTRLLDQSTDYVHPLYGEQRHRFILLRRTE
jgi:4-amino-4-deoxy-L-arabinose transferase-like glycosyltransferase